MQCAPLCADRRLAAGGVLPSTALFGRAFNLASMNEAGPIYAGGAFEGQDDSAAVVGQITVSMFCVKFESEAFTLDLQTQGLEVAFDESGERVLFSHPSYPNWTVYSLDPDIIHHRAFQQQFLKRQIE